MDEKDNNSYQDEYMAMQSCDDAPDRDFIYEEDGAIRSDFRKTVARALDAENADHLRGLVAGLYESEMGDLIESLKPKRRQMLVEALGDSFDFSSLTEVDEAVRVEIIENIPNEDVARAIGELDSDDAVFILEDLEKTDRVAIY